MKFNWLDRFGNKIVMSSITAGMIPVIILGTSLLARLRVDLVNQATKSHQTLTTTLSHGINAVLRNYIKQIEILAQDSDIKSMDKSRQTDAIFRFLELNPIFFSCYVYSDDWTITAIGYRNKDRSLEDKYVGKNLTDESMDEWQGTRDAFKKLFISGKPTFAEKVIYFYNQKMILAIVPIFDFIDQTKIIGAISCSISLEGPEIQELISEFPLQETEILILTDITGQVITARGEKIPQGLMSISSNIDLTENINSKPVELQLDEQTYFGILSPIKEINGFLLAASPRKKIFEYFRNLAINLSLLFIIAGILAGAFGFFVAKNLAEKVESLLEGIRLVSEGTVTHRVAISGRDELAEAGTALNKMIETLEKQRLMDEVWSRTWTKKSGEKEDGES